jgi:hypothetical protein
MNLKRMLLLLTSHLLLFNAAAVRADVWTATPVPPRSAGGGRAGHTAVWTGKYMIVWGGSWGSNGVGYGGVYDPVSETWRPTSLQNLPSTYLGGHTAVWAGEPVNRMLVYGGNFPPFGGDGGMYDPESDLWTKIEIDGDRKAQPPKAAPENVPKFRINHTAVWTGEEMIVWGGHCLNACFRNDGAAFNPVTQTWRAIKPPPFLAPRARHTAVWTGTKMLVWGGQSLRPYNDGGLYDPKADEWTPVTMEGAPSLRSKHTAVWTGRELIVWGGQQTLVVDGKLKGGPQFRADGKIYDPALDRWRPMSVRGLDTNAKKQAAGKELHTAVWTGEEMIVWGGANGGGARHQGYRYNLEADQWLPVTNTNSPTNRTNHTAVWTGNEMIVWAGRGRGGLYGYAGATGGAYRPKCGAYIYEPEEGARVNREVTFRLHLSPPAAQRRAQLFVDGEPHGEWQEIRPDSRVKFTLGDELAGPHELRVKTEGAGGAECLSSEVSVNVGVTVKVLRLVYDPVFDRAGMTFRQMYGYHDPDKLTTEYILALGNASGWFVNHVNGQNDTVRIDGYVEQVNGHVLTDDEYINRLSNKGWANMAGTASSSAVAEEVSLGNAPDSMRYAQRFKVWGAGLKGVRLKLKKVGWPSQSIRISVREELDGADLWTGTVGHGDRPHTEDSGYYEAQSAPFELRLRDSVPYYLLVEFGEDASARPDPNNHYKLGVVRTTQPVRGRPEFTDAEAELFQGLRTRHEELDMELKLLFTDRADYRKLLEQTVLPGRSRPVAEDVRDGLIDEVWAFDGPLRNMWEAAMMGPGAFDVNGEPWPDVNSGRAFVVMGFNYERDATEMVHNYGHRTEGTMTHVYGAWNNEGYGRGKAEPLPVLTNWDRFTAFKGVLPVGQDAACGAVHYAPNAIDLTGYTYDLPTRVRSTCDDWLTYPNLKGVRRFVNADTWERTQMGFLKWWFTRMPKAKGRNADGKLNNWWRYVAEPDYYK